MKEINYHRRSLSRSTVFRRVEILVGESGWQFVQQRHGIGPDVILLRRGDGSGIDNIIGLTGGCEKGRQYHHNRQGRERLHLLFVFQQVPREKKKKRREEKRKINKRLSCNNKLSIGQETTGGTIIDGIVWEKSQTQPSPLTTQQSWATKDSLVLYM